MHNNDSKQNKGNIRIFSYTSNNNVENSEIMNNKPMTKTEIHDIIYMLSEALFEVEPEYKDIDKKRYAESYILRMKETINTFKGEIDSLSSYNDIKYMLDKLLTDLYKGEQTRGNTYPLGDALEAISIVYPDLIRKHISDILDDDSCPYGVTNDLIIKFIDNDPSIVFEKIKRDERKYRIGGFSRSFQWGDEKDIDVENTNYQNYDYAFKQMLFQASFGTIKQVDNIIKCIKDNGLLEEMIEKEMFDLGKKRVNYNVFNALYNALTKEELIKYNDKLMNIIRTIEKTTVYSMSYKLSKINTLKEYNDKDSYYIKYHNAKERSIEKEKEEDINISLKEDYYKTSKCIYGTKNITANSINDNKSFLEINYNEIMKLTSESRRADLFMLALCDTDIDDYNLAKSLYHLRREDIETVISHMLKNDFRFLITPKYTNSFDYTKIIDRLDYTYLKERLANVIKLNISLAKSNSNDKGVKKYSIFNNVKEDELKIIGTRYEKLLDMFTKKIDVDAKRFIINKDSIMASKEEEVNRALLEFERMNLIKILSQSSKEKKMKAISGIINQLVISRDINEDRRAKTSAANEAFSYQDKKEYNKSPYTYKNKQTDKVYRLLENELIKEYYESIGVDYDSVSINKAIQDKINFGIEIEEINVSNFMHGQRVCTPRFSCKPEYTILPANKDDNEQITTYGEYNHAGEYISKILNTNELDDLKEVNKELELLSRYGATTNSSCGMHIHVSKDNTRDKLMQIAPNITRNIYEMQDMLINKLCCYDTRIEKTARKLTGTYPDMANRYYIVNVAAIMKHGSVEFRLFNMPDSLDKKVVESYIDFAACFYDKIDNEVELSSIVNDSINYIDTSHMNKKQIDDYKFNVLLETLEVKDDTKKVLTHLDEIFRLYNAKDILDHKESTLYENELINYYDDNNLSIIHEEEMNEEKKYDSEMYKLAEEIALLDICEEDIYQDDIDELDDIEDIDEEIDD